MYVLYRHVCVCAHPEQYMSVSLKIYNNNISFLLKHDDCNLEIYGISYAIIWVKEELEFDFLNYDATTLVDIGHWLKKIYTCASVVCNGSTYLPDVWLKRKIGLMCKSIDYGGRSVEGIVVYFTCTCTSAGTL